MLLSLLFKEGGNQPVLAAIHAHLSQPGSDIFFECIRDLIAEMANWYANKLHLLQRQKLLVQSLDPLVGSMKVRKDKEEQEIEEEYSQEKLMLFKMLEMMCGGHFKPNQEILREQPNNEDSINLLQSAFDLLVKLDCFERRSAATVTMSCVCATILHWMQGPNKANQRFFSEQTTLVEVVNRQLRSRAVPLEGDGDDDKGFNDCEMELKISLVKILLALLEGQRKP